MVSRDGGEDDEVCGVVCRIGLSSRYLSLSPGTLIKAVGGYNIT